MDRGRAHAALELRGILGLRTPGRYRATVVDRLGPEVVEVIGRSLLAGVLVGLFVALGLSVGGARAGALLLGAGIGAIGGGILAFVLFSGMLRAGSAGALALVQPSGNSTPFERDFSREDALVARGLVGEALASYEMQIIQAPADVQVRLRAADLYAGPGKNPERAAELLRQVQRAAGVAREHDVYASNRLIDLYRGPLADEGRVLVELRRLIDRYPNASVAHYWRAAIRDIQRARS